jgi:polyisoprenoid-binding protein YceI
MRKVLFAAMAASLLAGPALAQQGAAPAAPAAPAQAPAGVYVLDPAHTSVSWKVLHRGLSWYTARFTGVSVELDFNPADVTKSKVTATIDPKSVETDYAKTSGLPAPKDFNAEIANQFLKAAEHPKITFVSKSVAKTGDKTGKMTGDLTFLGVTKPVTLDVTYTGNANDPRSQKHKVGFSATGSFKRSDFGMGAGPNGDEAKIEINAEFTQK